MLHYEISKNTNLATSKLFKAYECKHFMDIKLSPHSDKIISCVMTAADAAESILN